VAEQEDQDYYVELISSLAKAVFDQDCSLLRVLHDTVFDLHVEKPVVSSELLNFLVWGAAHFGDKDLLAECLLKASVLNYKLDLQTYFKV